MTNKELVKGFFIEAYENLNHAFAMQHFADDYIDHSPAGARSNTDAVGILKIVEHTFSDIKLQIHDLIEEDNLVATRITFSATQVGEYQGVPPTGKRIAWEALENFRIQDGKIAESWGYWPDMMIRELLLSDQ